MIDTTASAFNINLPLIELLKPYGNLRPCFVLNLNLWILHSRNNCTFNLIKYACPRCLISHVLGYCKGICKT